MTLAPTTTPATPTAYTDLSVDNPANSPWITAAGGTTEAGQIPIADSIGNISYINIPAQRAWGCDYLWPYYATLSYITGDTTEAQFASDPAWTGGSGGGYSVSEPRPAYQSKIANIGDYTAVPYLTPTTYVTFGTTTTCTGPTAAGIPCVPTAWTTWADGGTGVVAPPAMTTGTASRPGGAGPLGRRRPGHGLRAVLQRAEPEAGGWLGRDELRRAAAERLRRGDRLLPPPPDRILEPGHLQVRRAQLHAVLSAGRARPASNDNLYYTGTAGHIYNPGTGLGTPNLGKLALDFKNHG